MAVVDWSQCPLAGVIPGKVSGAPLVKNTRLLVERLRRTTTHSVTKG